MQLRGADDVVSRELYEELQIKNYMLDRHKIVVFFCAGMFCASGVVFLLCRDCV